MFTNQSQLYIRLHVRDVLSAQSSFFVRNEPVLELLYKVFLYASTVVKTLRSGRSVLNKLMGKLECAGGPYVFTAI